MRIYLVSPSHYLADGSILRTTRYWTSGLTMATLKALTPARHRVTIVDELFRDVDLDADCDVVGLGAMGPQIQRAFDLGDHFRKRGKKVVLGGPWVTLTPERALEHADAVVAGDAEGVWETVLDDLEAGRSRGIYKSDWVDLADYPHIDYRDLPLLKWDAFRTSPTYRRYFHWPLIFSRGCPHPCSYCAVQAMWERTYRTRPVEAVIDDVRRIKSYGGRKLLFLDDNPIGAPNKAKALFEALIPEKIKWASQCTINIARDPELLDLAARSGCVSLSIGLETTVEENLAAVNKKFNKPFRFADDLAAIRGKGIQVIALMMVGLDSDDLSSFERTERFLFETKCSLVKLFTPCPYPGTEFHDEMRAQGRILNENWGQYTYGAALIDPANMSIGDMMAGFQKSYERIYSLGGIARRMLPPPRGNYMETLGYLVANLKTYGYLKKHPEAWGTIS